MPCCWPGSEVIYPCAREVAAREMVLNGDMGEVRAKKILLGLNKKQFRSRLDLVECLASLTKLFPDEVNKTCTDGRRIRQVLYTFTSPHRLEWLLNFRRAKQHLVRRDVDFMSTGTTSNEALDKEFWCVSKQDAEVYATGSCSHTRCSVVEDSDGLDPQVCTYV